MSDNSEFGYGNSLPSIDDTIMWDRLSRELNAINRTHEKTAEDWEAVS